MVLKKTSSYFVIHNRQSPCMCWNEEKVRSKLVGAKYPFPFHRFPVVWERCHINQSLDSFHLRDQQSLSPTWSGIRWQLVKRCGLCTAEGFAILIVLAISQAFDQPAICVLSLLFFSRKLSSWFLIFSINICNELFKIFLSKALLLSNIYKCYSSLIWPGHPRIQHSIVFVLLAPKWGRTWYEGGEGGIGCIIQKGRGEGCQLLLHVGHSIHRATTVTTIIFVAQGGKCFWRFVSQT